MIDHATWRARLGHPGWVLLPQRIFLGVTFIYAAFDKLTDPNFLNPSAPTGITRQTEGFAHTSPIGAVLRAAHGHERAIGLLIALTELAVGCGVLLGLFTRAAAAVGSLLAVTFLLTVSWQTTPYYYGSDIVFLFCFLPIVAVGAEGVLSLDAVIARQALERSKSTTPTKEITRRRVLLGARYAAIVAILGLGAGGLASVPTASERRKRERAATAKAQARGSAPPVAPATPATPDSSAGPNPQATNDANLPVIATLSDVPVGAVFAFDDPGSGDPAYVLQPAAGKFLAYSRICTHAGCTISISGDKRTYVCPCHGTQFDVVTGDPLPGGQTNVPLNTIPVEVRGTSIVRPLT